MRRPASQAALNEPLSKRPRISDDIQDDQDELVENSGLVGVSHLNRRPEAREVSDNVPSPVIDHIDIRGFRRAVSETEPEGDADQDASASNSIREPDGQRGGDCETHPCNIKKSDICDQAKSSNNENATDGRKSGSTEDALDKLEAELSHLGLPWKYPPQSEGLSTLDTSNALPERPNVTTECATEEGHEIEVVSQIKSEDGRSAVTSLKVYKEAPRSAPAISQSRPVHSDTEVNGSRPLVDMALSSAAASDLDNASPASCEILSEDRGFPRENMSGSNIPVRNTQVIELDDDPPSNSPIAIDDDDDETAGGLNGNDNCWDLLAESRKATQQFGLLVEHDFTDAPRLYGDDFGRWPCCAIIHTFMHCLPDFDWCRSVSTLDPSNRMRLASWITDDGAVWNGGLGVQIASMGGFRLAANFMSIAGAIVESLVSSPATEFKTRIAFGLTTESAVHHRGGNHVLALGEEYEGALKPVTIYVHSPRPSEILRLLISERSWATYVRRRYPSQSDTILTRVNCETLSPAEISTNIYARDCLLTGLCPKLDSGTNKFQSYPNLDFLFRQDKYSPDVVLFGSDRRPARGSFGWSALPRGKETFRDYPAELLSVFEPGNSRATFLVSPMMAMHCPEDQAVAYRCLDDEFFDGSDGEEIRGNLIAQGRPIAPVEARIEEDNDDLTNKINDMFAMKEWSNMQDVDSHVPYMSTELLPHQRKGVWWMTEMETQARSDLKKVLEEKGEWNLWVRRGETDIADCRIKDAPSYLLCDLQPPKGGILADDMGLGKTIQSIAMCLLDPIVQSKLEEYKQSLFKMSKGRKVLAKKAQIPEDDCVTIGTRKFYRSSATLIVVPKSVLNTWISQLQEHTEVSKELIASYYGAERNQFNTLTLGSKIFVVTTYATVSQAAIAAGLSSDEDEPGDLAPSPLYSIYWRRIILDEAHTIRNKASRTTNAVLQLDGVYKWCLTGTPLQNKIDDLCPLLQFLRVQPFDTRENFQKIMGSNAKKNLLKFKSARQKVQMAIQWILLRRKKSILDKTEDTKSATLDSAVSPSVPESGTSPQSGSSKTSSVAVAQEETVRQVEITANHDLGSLPPKTIHMVSIKMSNEEWTRYAALAKSAQRAAERARSDQVAMLWTVLTHLRLMANTEAVVSDHIRRDLDRMISDSPTNATNLIDSLLGSKQMSEFLGDQVDEDCCPICLGEIPDTMTNCLHLFHFDCISTWLDNNEHCPVCRKSLNKKKLVRKSEAQVRQAERLAAARKDAVFDSPGSSFVESSKVRGLCDRIAQDLAEEQKDDKPNKVVVFSTFVKLLVHVQEALKRRGVETVLFDGKLSMKKRDKIVKDFQGSKSNMVMLASIKAAGTGLTLTAAHVVYVMDPWWNPHVEDQAIDRVYRIGQTRPVRVYRVVSRNTVEEAVVKKQKAKRIMAAAALENGKTTGDVGTLRDLQDVLLNPVTGEPESDLDYDD